MSRPPEDLPPRADTPLEEDEARLRALVAASTLGIDIMDLEGRPIFSNPKCEELHGIDFREAIPVVGWWDSRRKRCSISPQAEMR